MFKLIGFPQISYVVYGPNILFSAFYFEFYNWYQTLVNVCLDFIRLEKWLLPLFVDMMLGKLVFWLNFINTKQKEKNILIDKGVHAEI